jgi:hypothetical protein
MIRVGHPGSGSCLFTHPGSWCQKGTGSRIRTRTLEPGFFGSQVTYKFITLKSSREASSLSWIISATPPVKSTSASARFPPSSPAYDPLNLHKQQLAYNSVADPQHFDADPNPACLFDANPDTTFSFDADPDPSLQIKAQDLENVLKKAHIPYILACHLQTDVDTASEPAYQL